MNELIPIHNDNNGKRVVSARDLHAFLESKQQFGNWINNRIKKYGFVENQDYAVFNNSIKNPSGGRPETEYALTLDCAKEISMVEGNAKGKQARQYFIACEKQLKEESKPLTTAQMFAMQSQVNLEYEQRMNQIESKVNSLINRATEAEQELKTLPVSNEKVPEMSLRDKIRQLVNAYSSAAGIFQQTIWDNIYRTLYYNYHVSIKNYPKDRKSESWLEVAERTGHLDKIYIIISNLLREKGIASR